MNIIQISRFADTGGGGGGALRRLWEIHEEQDVILIAHVSVHNVQMQ